MRSRTQQSGFSAVEVLITLVVVAIIGYLGYTFYNGYQDKMAKSAESANTVSDTADAPVVTTSEDLDKASTALDQTDVESGNNDDMSELDKEISNF